MGSAVIKPTTKTPRLPIRIGFVMHIMEVAGAEMLVAETIRRLGKKLDPVIFCLDGIGQLGVQLQSEGVEIVDLGRQPGRDWGLVRRFARQIRQHKIKLLHAHQYTPFFYAALAKAACFCRPRLILTEHGRHYPDNVSSLRRNTNRYVMRHFANAVNAVCEFSAESLGTNDGFIRNRIEVIENGIEVSKYGPAPDVKRTKSSLGLDPGKKHIATIARFHPIKDHETLIRAFDLVVRKRSDTELLLVGDGQMRADMERLAQSLGIDHSVKFLGVRSDVAKILSAADLFALTSISEAASLTLMEAMASGVPVVVTNVGGNPEIVRSGVDGFLAPRGDYEAIAEAMLRLLAHPEMSQKFGESGLSRANENYRLDLTIGRYFELYREMLH